jgi:hypothetical protein
LFTPYSFWRGNQVAAQDNRFVDRVFRLLERVEYRRADSLAEKRAIYRMRHAAYARAGTVDVGPSGLFCDAFDETANAWIIGVFLDGELASSVRLHIAASPAAPLPVASTFPNAIGPLLRAGRTLIDPTRFVAKLEFSQRHAEIPYVTLRASFMAGEFFDVDFMTAACLAEHQAFYRRMFGGVAWAQPQPYPHFNRPMALIGYDCRMLKGAALERYPFFASTAVERRALFGQSSNAAEDVFEAIGRRAKTEAHA